MAKALYYSPRISRFLVSALYHEAKRRQIPMTKLADELITRQLDETEGLRTAQENIIAENPTNSPISHR